MYNTPMNMDDVDHPMTRTVLSFARSNGVEVYDISKWMRQVGAWDRREILIKEGATRFPFTATEHVDCFCSMGEPERGLKGAIWTTPFLVTYADEMTDALFRSATAPEKGTAILLHEVAHTLIGKDEIDCTTIERQMCKHLFSTNRRLYSVLVRYAPDSPTRAQAAETKRAVRKYKLLPEEWGV